MSTDEGKGWAKGRTANGDPRIARAAAAHRHATYRHHVPFEQDRRYRTRHGTFARRTLPLGWSPTMAYIVGLIATDGCLISGRKVLNFKSEDEQLVRTFLRCLGRPLEYQQIVGRGGRKHFATQFGDAPFYDWLRTVGLMPRKSLVLESLAVPDPLLVHCARGLLDGDGSILHYWYEGGGKAAGRRYEGFATRFVSASRPHLAWLETRLCSVIGVHGSIAGGDHRWALTYSIHASTVVLPALYPSEDIPKLERKWLTWQTYALSHGHIATGDGASANEASIAMPEPRAAAPV